MKLLNPVGILLIPFLLSITACDRKSDGPSAVEATFQQQECQSFIRSLSADFEYGWVTVPENYENPSSGPQIKVFYWYEKKNQPKRHIVFFNGGPTFHSHNVIRSFKRGVKKYGLTDAETVLIFVDQRGTGCSTPYPDPINDTEKLRARFYGSTGIVNDSEVLRKKIVGDKKWGIFGQSFGGHVVHRYVSLYPQSVEFALSHGYAVTSDPLRRLMIRILGNYRALEGYFTKNPEHRPYFEILLKKFSDKNFCLKNQYKEEFCGYEIMEWMIQAASFNSEWDHLANFFNSLPDSSEYLDMAIFMKWFNDYADEPGIYSPRASWAHSVILYTDRNVIPTNEVNCLKVYTLLREEKGLNLQDLTTRNKSITECTGPIQFQTLSKRAAYARELFGSQRDILTMDAFKKGILELGKNKFFLFSSSKDGYMPPEVFEEEVTAVGHLLNYQNFNNSGHEGYVSEPEILKKVFLP